jgi:hypothetical protein
MASAILAVSVGLGASLTVVLALAELLDVLESVSLAVTLTELVMVPAVVAVTTMDTVELLPLAREPRSQVTVLPDWLQLPWLGVADTKVTPEGRVSVRVTPEALQGPLLVTVAV